MADQKLYDRTLEALQALDRVIVIAGEEGKDLLLTLRAQLAAYRERVRPKLEGTRVYRTDKERHG